MKTAREMGSRSKRLVLALLGLCLAAGCASRPAKVEIGPPARASLTIVGWSLRSQAPIAVRGTLTDGVAVRAFATHGDPAAGTLIDGLAPGNYRIEITARVDCPPAKAGGGAGTRVVPARGFESVYLEPGASVRREVAVDDRDPEVGLAARAANGG